MTMPAISLLPSPRGPLTPSSPHSHQQQQQAFPVPTPFPSTAHGSGSGSGSGAGSYFPPLTPKRTTPGTAHSTGTGSGTTPTLHRLAELTLRSPLPVPVPSGAASAQGLATAPLPLSLSKPRPAQAGPAPTFFPPSALVPFYQQQQQQQVGKVLVLDLRPPSAFLASHLPHSLSLPIPSTLLRRPAFPLSSVSQMLPSSLREKFDSWSSAELILVLEKERDGLGDGGRGLVAKFEREGRERGVVVRVGGIRGGWEAVRKLLPDALVQGDEGGSPAQAIAAAASLSLHASGSSSASAGAKRPSLTSTGSSLRDLPFAAFQQSTTSLFSFVLARSADLPPARTDAVTTTAASSRPAALHLPMPPLTLGGQHAPKHPFPSLPLSNPNPEQPAALPPSSTSFLATNPFYDNIRQHLELAQGVTGTRFEPLVLPQNVREYARWGLMPGWLREVVDRSSPGPGTPRAQGLGRRDSSPRVEASPQGTPSPPLVHGSASPGTPPRRTGTGSSLSPLRGGSGHSIGVSDYPHARGHPPPASASAPAPAQAHVQIRPDGGEALAMQFYKVELGEQRRLMGVMEHHTRESMLVPTPGGVAAGHPSALAVGSATVTAAVGLPLGAERQAGGVTFLGGAPGWSANGRRLSEEGEGKDEFPFSITAGIEKGTLNRYRNIWPFAHTRVRLPQGTASDGSDYVNASFVHPRGTRRRYVCAQGPLEATRGDFWNLVWDQNITTIIMLTKQTEAGLSKCFPYWSAPMAGPFRLRHISTTGGEDEPAAGGFFDLHGAAAHDEQGAIRRVFALSREGAGERIVTQLQMVSWPDWEVPRSPRTLLDLIRQTNALRAASPRPNAPVLVHCSAGVGRTGSFVLIDAVLDALRSELLATKARLDRGERARSPHAMHVDSIGGSGTGTTSASPSFSSLSLSLHSLHRQSSLDSSAPTSRSASTDISSPPSPGAHLAARHALLPSSEANPQSQNTFDYKIPRSALARDHPSRTPTPLSDMEPDPIQHVLEDMREQRMSLCQSLNQYVFCHRAICEGAVELAEEIFGPTEYSLGPALTSGPSTVSPNAMDVEPSPSLFFGKTASPMPLHHPHAHAKRAASKSPEEVERVLSLTPDDFPRNSTSPRGFDGLGRKPSLKRQMTRRGDVQSGSASPAPR
ncbi:hypothetical protein CALVIDRAFT_534237 [Calocera viscosa TUFC12733]|uniref:protein-tyrosine-phosphatase n=1 Tax=Calocera viscosa (strain TUFC12733) TaxID=1330018 RepID=A0A167QJ55_CALVF|nr:hypothetical protein CALVIDRAFT_534237 [Calocera viscosa TUFC12733]